MLCGVVGSSLKVACRTQTVFTVARFSSYPPMSNKVVTRAGAQAIQGLEPRAVWELFGTLSSIPRPSFHEEGCVLDFHTYYFWWMGR